MLISYLTGRSLIIPYHTISYHTIPYYSVPSYYGSGPRDILFVSFALALTAACYDALKEFGIDVCMYVGL